MRDHQDEAPQAPPLDADQAPVDAVRRGRKIAYIIDTMPAEMIEEIANSRMEPGHEHLDALMDD